MTNRWPRFLGGSDNDAGIRHARESMTTAFLTMDARQRIVETAVEASAQLFPEQGIRRGWAPVRDACYAAATAYLALSDVTVVTPPGSAPVSPDRTTRQLSDATHALDEFYATHRDHLEHAVSTLEAVPQVAHQADAAATAVAARLRGPDQGYAGYSSVRAGSDELDAAAAALGAARARHDAKDIRAATSRVLTAVAGLQESLGAAPTREHEARTALASVRTRVEAARTRAGGLRAAYSDILREFTMASSLDLTGNEQSSHRHIEAAAAGLVDIERALSGGDPDLALEHTERVRTDLAAADHAVDSVTDRLRLLREVRGDPGAKLAAVRFRLKDAQHLAVNTGLAGEWGSVLDAQVDRIDRISGALQGTHPDYWAYITELDAVSEFIAGVVQRMRGQASKR
ncbi:hypothetical protein [Rhodococcus kronopolitis]|uniref:Uncharacterized protein n=1 Tax=Rhodococcus kronopolitis TaxID=1460226 RepID=A0ABV9FPK5_9NOCA